MAEFELYKIGMELSGRLTQLPDSQKLFGALMYLYSDQITAEHATLLVQNIKEGSIYCALSDLLPVDYLPLPQTYLLDLAEEKIQGGAAGKAVYKAIKKREYIKKEQLEELLKNPSKAEQIFPYVCLKESQQIHASIDSLKYDLPGLDPNLYSVPEVTAAEICVEEDRKGVPLTSFHFFLLLEKNDLCGELISALKQARNVSRPFFLGPRSSQGVNLFTVSNIVREDELLNLEAKYYLNTGMLLPAEIKWNKSAVRIFTSERRPYDRQEGWDDSSRKQFISFIRAGSIVIPEAGIRHAGRCIEYSPGSRNIVFGNAFLFPLKGLEE